jgi:hypothetical protein
MRINLNLFLLLVVFLFGCGGNNGSRANQPTVLKFKDALVLAYASDDTLVLRRGNEITFSPNGISPLPTSDRIIV